MNTSLADRKFPSGAQQGLGDFFTPSDGPALAGLSSALDEGLSRSAFLIGLIGVAGAGKTTRVQAWAAACDRQVRWISLKEVLPSRLPQTLLSRWAEGLGGSPLSREDIASMAPDKALSQLRQMVKSLAPRSVWVMDDCDRSLQSPEGQALLEALMEEAVSDARLLLLSRLPGCLEPLAERHAERVHLLEWGADWPLATPASVNAIGRGSRVFEEVEVALKLCSVAGIVIAPLLEILCPAVRMEQIAAAMPACDGFLRSRRHQPGVYELHPLFRQVLHESLLKDFGCVNVNQIRLGAAEILRREGFEFEAIVLMAKAGDEACALLLTQQMFSRTSVVERFGFWLQQNRHLIGHDQPLSGVWQSIWKRLDRSGPSTGLHPTELFHRHASSPLEAGKGVWLESWCRYLRLLPCENGTSIRLDAERAWFDDQRAWTEEAQLVRHPEVLTTITSLHVLRQPGAESTMLWQERALGALFSQQPSPAHIGQLVLIALHLFLSRDRFRLDWMRDWWMSVVHPSPGANRLCALLEAMAQLLAGDRQSASKAILALEPHEHVPLHVAHLEALVMAVCGWYGLEIPQRLIASRRSHPGGSLNVMDGCFDVAKVNLLLGQAIRLGDARRVDGVFEDTAAALQSGVRMEGVARFLDMSLHLAIVQAHAFHGEAQGALDRLALLRGMPYGPECLTLLSDAALLIEAYCQSRLDSASQPARESARQLAVRLSQTGGGLCLHPRLRERMLSHLQPGSAPASCVSVAPQAAFEQPTTPVPYAVEQAILAMEGRDESARVQVRTFGELSLTHWAADSTTGQPLRLSRKLSRILLFILLKGMKRPARIDEVCDEMWPNADGAAAKSNFDSAIHRLRQLLRSSKAIVIENGGVSINREYCCVDLDFLDRLTDVNVYHLPPSAMELVAEKLIGILSGPTVARDLPLSGMSKIGNEIVEVVTTLVGQLTRCLDREGLHDLALRLYQCHTIHVKVDPGLLGSWKRLLIARGRDDEARCLTERFGDVDVVDVDLDDDLRIAFRASPTSPSKAMNVAM